MSYLYIYNTLIAGAEMEKAKSFKNGVGCRASTRGASLTVGVATHTSHAGRAFPCVPCFPRCKFHGFSFEKEYLLSTTSTTPG